ncbi:MAG TPA: hypothetical protein VNS19_07335 [Acidimicrobiales bacterium]|nr:hypothetical protein [Acidimicrobiales bacterium]
MPEPRPADRPAAEPVAVSPAMRLLLAAALRPQAEAADAWAAWVDAVDFERLEDGATPLLGLVARNLPDLQAEASIVGRVRGVQRLTWAANQVLWSAAQPFLQRLESIAGTPILLPPAALVPAFGDAWGARPWHRIELGLHPGACADGRAALAASGWPVGHLTPRRLAWTEAGLVDRWEVRDAAGNWVSIRWQLLRDLPSAAVGEQLRGAAIAATVGSVRVHLLHPADALVERLWNAPGERGPGWMVEVVVSARQLGGRQPDVERFAARAGALGIAGVLRERLAEVASAVDDPSVAAARRALDQQRPGALEALWNLPGPVAGVARNWAAHAAGQGLAAGARSMVRTHRAVGRVR